MIIGLCSVICSGQAWRTWPGLIILFYFTTYLEGFELKTRKQLIGLYVHDLSNDEFSSIFKELDINSCDTCGLVEFSSKLHFIKPEKVLCKNCNKAE